MSNPVYCQFRNTLHDLEDCYQALCELNKLDELSETEEECARKMIKLCREIADAWSDE